MTGVGSSYIQQRPLRSAKTIRMNLSPTAWVPSVYTARLAAHGGEYRNRYFLFVKVEHDVIRHVGGIGMGRYTGGIAS